MSLSGKCHRVIIFVHDPSSQAAYDGGVDVMTEGNLFRKNVETTATNRAVDILRFMDVTGG